MSWTAKPLSPWWQPDVVQRTSPPHPTPHASLAWGQSTGICYHFPLRLLKITEERQATQRRSQESVPEGKRRILTHSYCLCVRTALCCTSNQRPLQIPTPSGAPKWGQHQKKFTFTVSKPFITTSRDQEIINRDQRRRKGATGSQNISPELNTVERIDLVD